MSRIHFVASICHPRKFGLLDHALALQHHGQEADPQRVHVLLRDRAHLKALAAEARQAGGTGLCVIWDNSLSSLLAARAARRLGVLTAYYYHEPGGFGQKIFKADPFFYALKATLGEWVFRRSTDFQLVARPDKIGFGHSYCPLLFDDRRPVHAPDPRVIGFLGARRNQRLYNLFSAMQPDLAAAGYRVAYFPSAEHGHTTQEKFSFLSRCSAVWNAYGVPYNQSGVTGDCVMSGTPVICSGFEPFLPLLREWGLGVELDLMQPRRALTRRLLSDLANLGHAPAKVNQAEMRSRFGGRDAFIEHWLPFFEEAGSGSRAPAG